MKLPLQNSLLVLLPLATTGFAPNSLPHHRPPPKESPTSLKDLLDLPPGFFTVTMFGSGLILSFAKSFGRLRMEERAWEQRLEEGRKRRLAADPTLTELDLRRKEAAMEWSAYGTPRLEEEAAYQKRAQEVLDQEYQGSQSGGTRVMEREDEDSSDERSSTMTDKEINLFEAEFGIDYDPYYDDPYEEDELPEGNFRSDKRHGDRFYEDGEIFYKDANTGLFYRQGAKPRTVSFF